MPLQLTAPSVAFEIPTKKKTPSGSSPTIQKKLVARANSPRRDLRLADLDRMLNEASRRKEEIAVEGLAKTTAHNEQLKSVCNEKLLRESSGIDALEQHIRSRLGNAEAKRNSMAASWARKLSAKAKAKARRIVKAKEEVARKGRKLEAKIDGKETAADSRREERNRKVSEGLALSNQEKLRRGQLAIGLAEVEARKMENQSERKIVSADRRRDMQHIQTSARLGEATAEKKKRATAARQQEEKETKSLRSSLEEKSKLAKERRQLAMERKASTATQLSDKLQRVTDIRSQKRKEIGDRVDTKIRLAEERRENIIAEKVSALQESANKKEQSLADKQNAEETTSKQRNKEIQSKLMSAMARKENILATKVEAASQQTKSEHAKNAWLTSLHEAKELKETSDKRLLAASQRKNKIMKEMVDKIQDVNKSKIEKVAQKNKPSSTKKRGLSPGFSPAEKKDLDECKRTSSASRRCVALRTNKIEKAKGKNDKTGIKKALFAAVSPRQNVNDGPRKQNRIEASNLGDISTAEEAEGLLKVSLDPEDDEPEKHDFGVPLVAIGGIAVVLVGLLLSCKINAQSLTKMGIAMDASHDVTLPQPSRYGDILKSALPYYYWSPPRQ